LSEVYDIIIVGGGPAGLAAGIYGSRSRLKTVILQKGLQAGRLPPLRNWKITQGSPGEQKGLN